MAGERVVFKYPLPQSTDIVRIDVPVSSRPAHFAAQRDVLTVWIDRPAPADAGHVYERHEFVIRGTGDSTPEGPWTHVGSTLVDDGMFVFHLYARIVGIPER